MDDGVGFAQLCVTLHLHSIVYTMLHYTTVHYTTVDYPTLQRTTVMLFPNWGCPVD